MHLPEIFGLLTFPVFQTFRTFDVWNYTKNLLDFPGIKFCKNVLECTGMYRKCQKSTVILKNFDITSTFRYIPSIKWYKLVQNDSKNGQNSQKLYRDFRLSSTFGLSTLTENVPVFPVHKNVLKFETVTGTNGLNID